MTERSRLSQAARWAWALGAAMLAWGDAGVGRAEEKVPAADNPTQYVLDLDAVPSKYFSYRSGNNSAQKTMIALQSLSDADLRDALSKAQGPRLELLLTETVRRGGEDWKQWIVDRWKMEREPDSATNTESPPGEEPTADAAARPSVQWLTAMRRLEGKPDPLKILVVGKRRIHLSLGQYTNLFVALTNLDVDHAALQFTAGGNYRSGRQARWRLEITDANGQVLPQRGHPEGFIHGGGLYEDDTLQYGESWATELAMASYVRFDAPGEYTLRVLYHDHATIADCQDVTGLITCRSLPIHLTVDPVEVHATAAELKEIASVITQLPADGNVKFLDGEYRKDAYEFIDPDSAPGKLLAWKWQAVPAMIDQAIDENTKPVQRAWLLALLASITGAHDPRFDAVVLGDHESRGTGWSVWFGTPGSMSGGIGTASTHSQSGSSIDPQRQLEFARRWKVWREKEYVKVTQGRSTYFPF